MSADRLTRLAAGVVLGSFVGPEVPPWMLRWAEHGLGGVCLFGSNLGVGGAPSGSSVGVGAAADPLDASRRAVEQAAGISAALHRVRRSLVVAVDEEGGVVTRLEARGGSSVPGNAALGVVDDPDLTRAVAGALGQVLGAAGVDLDLAPCADVNVDAANPAIGVRSFGADAGLVARQVAAFVAGLQDQGVAACAKHFPGHGATAVDSHLELPRVEAPADLLHQRELVPFRAAVEAGVATVMVGHLLVPALDGEAATVSRPVLVDLLRHELGFGGAVVTDALDMRGIGGPPAIPANVVRAVRAGADLCCLGPRTTEELVEGSVAALVEAVRRGELDEERLHDAVERTESITSAVAAVPAAAERGPALVGEGPLRMLEALGREAARRALRIDGALPESIRGAHVVEVRREPMFAEGFVPWGVAPAMQRRDAEVTSAWVDGLSEVPEVLADARRRPLVVVVRDPQGRERTAQVLAALVAGRPDAVVVDMGWPHDPQQGPVPAARLSTFGSSRASGEAVADLLAGVAGGDRPLPAGSATPGPAVQASNRSDRGEGGSAGG